MTSKYNGVATVLSAPDFIQGGLIDTLGMNSGASDASRTTSGSAMAGTAWSSANRAMFFPVSVPNYFAVQKCVWYMGTPSGNVDFGVYDLSGNRLASTGSTAASGSVQTASLALALSPGVYFLAIAADNTTITFQGIPTGSVLFSEVAGVQQMASAFPLPSTATFANPAAQAVPWLAIAQVGTI